MFPTTCATTASLSEPTRVADRHTMPARSPSIGGIISRAIGLPRIMFATLGVSPAGRLGPNPYHPSPKVTNIPLHQISTPFLWNIWSVQFSSVTQSCPTLCDPMNQSTSGLPVHHQIPEFTQIHVHRVSDAIQPSHPLSSLSPPAPHPSQHQGLFQ